MCLSPRHPSSEQEQTLFNDLRQDITKRTGGSSEWGVTPLLQQGGSKIQGGSSPTMISECGVTPLLGKPFLKVASYSNNNNNNSNLSMTCRPSAAVKKSFCQTILSLAFTQWIAVQAYFGIQRIHSPYISGKGHQFILKSKK